MTKKLHTRLAILVPFAAICLAAPSAPYAMVNTSTKITKPQGNFLPLPPRSNKHAVLPQHMRQRAQKHSSGNAPTSSAKPVESAKTASYMSKEDAHKLLLYVYEEMR